MKERFLKILKWFFIVLGVLFFAQIVLLIIIMIIASAFRAENTKIDIKPQKINLKEMQKIVDFAESYNEQNGKYPQSVDNIEIGKDVEYKYSTSNDDYCYKIDLKNTKTNSKKTYEHCNIQKDGLTSTSESYSESR